MSKLEESAFVIPPIQNSTGMTMKSQANVMVTNAGVAQGLSALFGGALGAGHFVDVTADGAKLYFMFSANATATLDPLATGSGPTVVYPLADGQTMSVVPVSGREVGTGIATMMNYALFVHARVASGGVPTGYLRMRRSSLAPGQNAGEFK